MWKILKHPLSVLGLLIGVGFNVLDALTTTQIGLPTSAWTAIAFVLFAIGVASIIHQQQRGIDTVRQQLSQSPTVTREYNGKRTLDRITQKEWLFIDYLAAGMLINHEHQDWEGLVADFVDGKQLGELIEGKCKLCGKPRNQKAGEE